LRQRTSPLSAALSIGLALAFFITTIVAAPVDTALSREPNRTLKLYFGHTKERGEFTFKRNGRYDRRGLREINQFLRDWRRNEPADMDPQLLDLIWAIYKESGSRDYIHVVSAYRSPETNNQLRKRSRGVAKNSQHTHGKAMDFYIPDVPLSKLRAIAMKMQGGGVGYYPRSGSPFVHVDTGSVRAWPRMTRDQLIALFPRGNTLHLPSSGKPLPGYEQAVARRQNGGTTTLAYLEEGTEESSSGNAGTSWLARVFPGGPDQEEDDAASGTPTAATPAPAAAPATGDPEILVATGAEDLDVQLPRLRPVSETEAALAELRPATTTTEADTATITTLAAAITPRARPDLETLSESLDDPAAPSLSINAEDAIAALARDAAAALPADNSDARIEVAFATAEPSEADRAILEAFATIGDLAEAPAPLPAPLPTAPASAATEHPAAVAAAALPEEEAPALQIVNPAQILIASAHAAEPSYREDSDELQQLISTPATYDPALAQLAMPQPGADANLYAPPEAVTLQAASTPNLPSDGFEQAGKANSGGSSFFSRLFAGLLE
jgi:uncharacterized protein YcbK (DUF882 family)